MHRLPLTLIGIALAAPTAAAEPISFRREVLPVLTKAGCNAGACHGTPTGKNGFRLSLRGYDPALDLASLTRDAAGRRINRIDPTASAILVKATAAAPHEGGKRFEAASTEYRILRDWIAQDAADDAAAVPVGLDLSPAEAILDEPIVEQPLHVVAHFADGSTRDVTHLSKFAVADETFASVSAAGVVRKRRTGEAAVSAEYMGRMATSGVLFRGPAPKTQWSDPRANNYIDTHVFAKLRKLREEPSPLCTDAEFVRRAHLDAIGRLPTPAAVRAFLADADPHKREKLVAALLDRAEFADWWGLKWTDRLGVNQRFVGKIGAVKYGEWVRHQIAANVPEDELARRVLTAGGGNYSNPPAGFYRRLRDPGLRAEEIAQLFLGVRIGCAKCHNHPGERWTQDDYYGLAAFFVRIQYRDGPFFLQIYDKEETVLTTRTTETYHPRTGELVPPKFPGGPVPTIGTGEDRRAVFAAWLTAPDNTFFAKAAANRIWFHLFGRGIVEPEDDFRITNPPANPALLDALAAELVQSGFDRKHLIRTIMNSRVYQLSSRQTSTNADDERNFARHPVRRLAAEQLLDAICDATGVPEKFPAAPPGTPAARLPDGEYKHPFLEAFGRPARAMACECERDPDTTLGQALHLVGGKTIDEKVRSASGRAATLAASQMTDAAVINELFLATLSRFPTEAERSAAVQRLSAARDRRTANEDVLHALVNHPEFVFQH
jgi:hypothetical protein